MSEVKQGRDYSGTGQVESSGRNFVKLDTKAATFSLDGGAPTSSFAGYLDRVDMDFKPYDAEKNKDLPARWQVDLAISAQSPTGEVKQYTLSLSSHWNSPLLGKTVNAIFGALNGRWAEDPDNRFIRFWLKMEEPAGGRPYCTVMVFGSSTPKDFLDSHYPWSESARRFEGVPEDREDARLFWLSAATQCVALTGGTIVGEDAATIKIPPFPGGIKAKSAAAAAPTAPPQPPPSTQGAAPTAPPAAGGESGYTKYEKALGAALNKCVGPTSHDFLNQVNDLFRKIETVPELSPAQFGWNEGMVLIKLGGHLNTKMAPNNDGTVPAAWDPAMRQFVLTASETDDLPF